MGANDFKNREVTILDKGLQIQFNSEFGEDNPDETVFYDKTDSGGVPLSLLVEGGLYSFIRGANGVGDTLETFIFDDVINPKFDTEEDLTNFLFAIISTEGEVGLKNTIIVKTQSDFGPSEGDDIFLKPEFTYHPTGEVIVKKNLILSKNVLIEGTNRAFDAIKFEGDFGFKQSETDGSFNIQSVMLTSTSGELFNITGVNTLFRVSNCNLVDNFKLGNITDSDSLVFTNCLISGTQNNGFVFDGVTGGLINILECLSRPDNNGVLFDFKGLWSVIDVDHLLAMYDTGQTVFKDSGLTISQGRLTICNFINIGSGILTDGFDKGTPEWKFISNLGVADSEIAGEMFFVGNTADTVISVAATPVLIEGVTTAGSLERFEMTQDNRLIYTGIEDVKLNIEAKMNMQAVVGNNQACKVYLAKNGVTVPKTVGSDTLTSQNSDQIMIANGVIDIVTGDFIEVFAENTGSTNNLRATDMIVTIHEK